MPPEGGPFRQPFRQAGPDAVLRAFFSRFLPPAGLNRSFRTAIRLLPPEASPAGRQVGTGRLAFKRPRGPSAVVVSFLVRPYQPPPMREVRAGRLAVKDSTR